MKNKIMAMMIVSTILLTACSSKTESTTTENQTTTVTTTTEVTTTTTIETTAPDRPEDFADVTFSDVEDKESNNTFASEFSFIDAVLFKDDNGVYRYPNYAAGKDITVTFKSDKEIKVGSIRRVSYPGGIYSAKEVSILDNYDYYGDLNEKEKKNENDKFFKMITLNEGVYTLTIPAKYAEQDNLFYVNLYTEQRDCVSFYVSCINEAALLTKPTFAIEDHAQVQISNVKVSDFNFVNAKISVSNNKHYYFPEDPKFPVNQDMVVTFKCKQKLDLESISFWEGAAFDKSEEVEISQEMLVYSKGTYTITLPAKYAVNNRSFSITMRYGNNSLYFFFGVSA